jgi:hypothetical protein
MPAGGDIFHTNTIQILDGAHAARSPHFRKGNLLISVHTLDVIAIVDPEQRRVVWALSGMWEKQHEPTLLANGNILLFDNLGRHGLSKVIELDPLSQDVAWTWAGDDPESFVTMCCGANQRLPNGNTLITESTMGRALEVAPDGETVWEFVNPHRAGAHRELIASLFEVVRIDRAAFTAEFAASWER